MHCSQSRSRLLIIARSPVASARNQIQPRPNNCGRSPPRTPAGLQDGPILVTCSTDRHRQGLGVASHRPPQGLPRAAPGASQQARPAAGKDVAPGPARGRGYARPTGRHTTPRVQDHSESKTISAEPELRPTSFTKPVPPCAVLRAGSTTATPVTYHRVLAAQHFLGQNHHHRPKPS
jgi:hypothetical protein